MSALDLRFAFRSLRKAPVFSAVAIASLALGIGANTAIFSLMDQMLLRMLPVAEPRRLVQLAARGEHYGSNWGSDSMSYPMYRDFRDRAEVFSGVLCRRDVPLSLGYNGVTERIQGELVSGNYFAVLGIKPAAGRTFTPEDDLKPDAHPVAVLSYGCWKSRFGGDPGVVGGTIRLNGMPMTVVGVSEAGFSGVEVGDASQVFVPVMMQKQMVPTMGQFYKLEDRRARWLGVFARLKPGISIEQAKAAAQPLYHQVIEQEVKEAAFRSASEYDKKRFLESRMEVFEGATGRAPMRRLYSTPLKVLMAITFAVLLIACANVASLQVARAVARQRELAMRLALGASRMQIVRQLLLECAVLSLAAAAIGVWVGRILVQLLLRFLPSDSGPLTISAALDSRMLVFTLGLAVATTFLFGLAPALQTSRPQIAATLKNQAVNIAGGPARLRKALVAFQVGLSLLLLIACGLFVRSLMNLRTVDAGFRMERLVKFAVDPPLQGYTKERTFAFYERLQEGLKSLPGYQSAGYSVMDLLGGEGEEWDSTVTVEGYQAQPGEDMGPHFNAVSPGYFTTVGIPIVAGRDFRRDDQTGSKTKVVAVNRTFANKYFPRGDALGRHLGLGGDPGTKTDIEIIAIVGDAKYETLRQKVPRQVFQTFQLGGFSSGMIIYVRSTAEPGLIFDGVKRTVKEIDPNMPVFAMRTMEEQASRTMVTERMIASLSLAFGFLATLLAVVGLYGVMAYTVARRTREIGIRMALGARSSSVVGMIMREAGTLVTWGLVLALPVSFGLGRLVRNQLFGIAPTDPWMIGGAAILLAAVTGAAGLVTALRASRLDPVKVLRDE